jgi:hypothetical protein
MGNPFDKGGGGGGGGGRRRVNVYAGDGSGRVVGTREVDDPRVTAVDEAGGFADADGVWHYSSGAGGGGVEGAPEIPGELMAFLEELGLSARSARQMSEELFGQTRPLRTGTTDKLLAHLRGEAVPDFQLFGQLPAGTQQRLQQVAVPEREILERQFRNARQSTIDSAGGRGGALTRSLADLEAQRAFGVTAHEANALNRQMQLELAQGDVNRAAFGQALQTGFGAPSTAISGVTASGGLSGVGANTLANLFGTEAGLFNASRDRSLATLGLLGGLLGGSAGRSGSSEQAKKGNLTGIAQGIAKGACWVAAALYGRGTPEWYAARRYMGARLGRVVAYRLLGPLVAAGARRSGRIRAALRPYFDRAVWEGA